MKTEDKQTGALVPSNERQQVPTTQHNPCNIFADPDGAGLAWTTLDPFNVDHVRLLQQIFNVPSTTINEYIGKRFVAYHMYSCRWSQIEEDTGELKEGIRISLTGPNGALLVFAGESARRCLERLCSIPYIGLPPWKHGLCVEVGQVVDGKKRRHTLTVPEDELTRLIGEYNKAASRC
jgi:hypothetical protein